MPVRLLPALLTVALFPLVPGPLVPVLTGSAAAQVATGRLAVGGQDVGAVGLRAVAQPAGSTPSPGRFDEPATRRDHGLPTALAAVLVAGVLSLLVRVLLAEPAARRRTPARRAVPEGSPSHGHAGRSGRPARW